MSADKIGHERHGILITNCTDVVQEENVLDLQIIDQSAIKTLYSDKLIEISFPITK